MQSTHWRYVRIFALFDLIVTGSLAIPVVSDHVLAFLLSGFGLLGTPSSWLPLPITTMIFCNLAGVLGVLWNGCRFLHPEPRLVRMDQWGRVVVAVLLVHYLIFRDAPAVLWLFVVSELAGSVAAWHALRAR